jgi:Zn-dependent protease with chaperone function
MNACRHAARVMDVAPHRAVGTLKKLERLLAVNRIILVGAMFSSLYVFGSLAAVREGLGEWIVVNEMLVLGPGLVAIAGMWWAYYPIDRRLREAALMRQIDAGSTIWPIWTRGQYVWNQFRSNVLLLGWSQMVDRIAPHLPDGLMFPEAMVIAGGMGIFLAAPLLIRSVWDTVPLADGPLRRSLLELCGQYRVGVRQLLLWRTYGGMINGAVMGLIGPLRYILLTDGLIERLAPEHVEAVMAHELGHVRRHHMPWLAICAIVPLMAGSMIMDASLGLLQQSPGYPAWNLDLLHIVGTGMLLTGWLLAFGFVSRRFERQADTFALQHMARKHADPANPHLITATAADIVSGALLRIASLNHQSPDRRSWRHGSIQWRVDYLQSLVGTPIDRCPIDLEMARLRWGAALAIVVMTIVDLAFRI